MDPGRFELPCRNSRQVASTRVSAVDRHSAYGRQQPRRNQDGLNVTRSGLSADSCLPDDCGTSPYRASGGFRAASIRPRERTACWQLLLCMLFAWPACSTARHDRTGLSGRSQFGPDCQRATSIAASLQAEAASLPDDHRASGAGRATGAEVSRAGDALAESRKRLWALSAAVL